MKVLIPILSRQAFGRLEPVIQAFDQSELDLIILVGGAACLSQYGDVREQLRYDAQVLYRPPDDSCGSMAFATGLALQELVPEFARLQPDLVFAHADRYETLSVAIAASYMNIPLAHTQGGEQTGSIDDKVRDAVSMLADHHFAATKQSAIRLRNMGCHNVFNVGCPSIDLAKHVKENEKKVTSMDLLHMLNSYGTGYKFQEDDEYILIVYHPDTTLPREEMFIELNELYMRVRDEICVWMLPNIDAGNEIISKQLRQYRDWQKPKIRFIANLPATDYLHVLNQAKYCIGNSSSFIREGSYFGVPSILIGDRQKNRELGVNVVKEYSRKRFGSQDLYGKGDAAQTIVKLCTHL